ncbi:MAG TPA: hypothetical protein VFZ17_00845, partial [Acidimicrobiia bacterium]|nr:hypothetical protein [Acidimicrobiia bacterium]
AANLPSAAAQKLTAAAQQAFVDGLHAAALVGVVLAAVAVVTVLRFLPARLARTGAMRGPLQSFEASAELLGGMLPTMPDEMHRREVAEQHHRMEDRE